MTEQTLEILLKDVDRCRNAVKKQHGKPHPYGWRTDIDNAPSDTLLLLRNNIGGGTVYRATLTKAHDGRLNRGICDMPWCDKDINESFYRDSILEWYYPHDKIYYLNEIINAEESISKMPHVKCSRCFPNGKIIVAYSDHSIVEY